MNMFRHENEGMEFVAAVPAISVESFQKQSDIGFDNKEPSTLPGRERYEVGSGRGDESSRLQEQTSAAGSRDLLLSLNRHE